MAHSVLQTSTASDLPTRPLGPSRHLLALVAASSLALAVIGIRAAIRPDSNPFVDLDSALIRVLISARGAAVLLAGLALGAVVAALVGWLRPAGRNRPFLTVVGLTELAGLGVAFQSVSTMALAGYLVAMALPVGLVWIAIQAVRRYRRARWAVLGAVVAAGTWGTVTSTFAPHHLAGLAQNLGHGFASRGGDLAMVVLVAVAAACWVLVLRSAVRRTPAVRAVEVWVVRHRRGITLLAAAGPLPYALIRASWLTPWPLLVPQSEALDPEIRLWGLLLGSGALLGAVLTVGLIRPWGRVFPRWMPWLGGRPVPVRAAVVPGGVVAGITCAAAGPMLQAILDPSAGTVFGGSPLVDRLLATLIFPFWIWGPALALAVWAYAASRSAVTETGPVARG